MIGGFIITGNESKRVIIRGIGPSMTSVGVPGVISDPILRLFGPSGSPIAVNDNWQDTQQVEIEATGLAPQDPRESAIIATLPPANYTATVADANGNNGVGLVEIYDLNSGGQREAGQHQHARFRSDGGERDDRGLCSGRHQHQSRQESWSARSGLRSTGWDRRSAQQSNPATVRQQRTDRSQQ